MFDISSTNLQDLSAFAPLNVRQSEAWQVGQIDRGICIGPALPLGRMVCEWVIQEFLVQHGPAKDMELANLFPDWKTAGSSNHQVCQEPSGRWYLRPRSWLGEGKWFNSLFHLGAPLKINNASMSDLLFVARALADTSVSGIGDLPGAQKATLHVPVDLRYSLREQLEEQLGQIHEIQTHLLTLSGRKGVFKTDQEVAERRFKCYALRKYGGLSASAIARLVYPDEKPTKAAVKIRKALQNVRQRLSKLKLRGA